MRVGIGECVAHRLLVVFVGATLASCLVAHAENPNGERVSFARQIQPILAANCFAQSELLMKGRSEVEVCQDLRDRCFDEEQIRLLTPHMVLPGNQPSNTILLDSISPRVLGALLTSYEHKVSVQGMIWNLRGFDLS